MALELWRSRPALARSPIRDLARMERDMEDVLSHAFRDWRGARGNGEARDWAPAVDVLDLKDEIVVRADLPGLDQKDIEITVDNGVLTIRGERKEEHEGKDEEYYCVERWAGRFSRVLTLPPGVNTDKTRAMFTHGVLEIHLPKTKEAAGRKVEIKAA